MSLAARLDRLLLVLRLQLVAAWDRRRLRRLVRRHPGLVIHPDASSAFASAAFHLEPGARVVIGPGVVTERRLEGVRISVRSGGTLEVGAGTWLRSDLLPVVLAVYEGAHMQIGSECFLNGCQVSAKSHVALGRRTMAGPGTRIWDSDQHDIDAERQEVSAPIGIGECVWIASDVTVLKGVEIGAHSIVGARSVVTRSLPAHTLSFGAPAEPRGKVGDRTHVSGSNPDA
jgi:acetyltransferase-like isoleucine patch superfamily enzyme